MVSFLFLWANGCCQKIRDKGPKREKV
jgi:hypothetical protein